MLARNGVRRDSASKRSRSSAAPARPAIAIEMDDRVGRSAERHRRRDRVLERRGRQDVARASGPPTPSRRCAGRRRRPCADARSRPRGWTTRRAASCPSASTAAAIVDAVPIVMHVPNERAMPSSISRHAHSSSVPARRSAQYFQTSLPRAERSGRASCRAASGRPARRSPAGSRWSRPSTSAGHGLVAAAEQDGAVDRVRAQRFLGLHRQQVAIEHRARLHERLAERQHRDLHREPAGLPDAALDLLGAQPEVRVARVRVAPGVEDRDDRLAGEVVGAEARLLRARAMAERAQIVRAEPAVAAQVVRRACADGSCRDLAASSRATGASWSSWLVIERARRTGESVRSGRCRRAPSRGAARAPGPTRRADPRAA